MSENHGYPGAQTVYRLYDAEGALLYVGVTHTPSGRFQQHSCSKVWWTDIATIKLEWFATRREAITAEAHAIRTEAPKYNEALSAAYLASIKADSGRLARTTCPECGQTRSVTPSGRIRRHHRTRPRYSFCYGSGRQVTV